MFLRLPCANCKFKTISGSAGFTYGLLGEDWALGNSFHDKRVIFLRIFSQKLVDLEGGDGSILTNAKKEPLEICGHGERFKNCLKSWRIVVADEELYSWSVNNSHKQRLFVASSVLCQTTLFCILTMSSSSHELNSIQLQTFLKDGVQDGSMLWHI